ncbi:MAG: peptide chain release factor N(5)-glutamine methyltransferase [Xanthomonadales bacterium]|nr:peptide chain release factor N(5)-glutamine methyltransferase [Xanthomonadales bacterium]
MSASPTLRQLLLRGCETLGAAANPDASPRLEGELLLAHCLDVDRAYLYAHADDLADPTAVACFDKLVQRRADGEPVAYLTGEQEFWSLPLRVTPSVLIPRPETELLVELALARLPGDQDIRVADIGTGSGAIALAIASERPRAEVHAVDVSADALAVARENARRLALGNVIFHPGSWCTPLAGDFDLVVSNPPYVRADDPHLGTGDLRFEPRAALTPGEDEYLAFRAIADGAAARLLPGGGLLFEHGFRQGEAVRSLLEEQGWKDVETFRDLAGLERVTAGRKPGDA